MIIFLYGDSDFKIKQKLKELKSKFVKDIDSSGQNIFLLDGEKIKIEDLSSKVGISSLFSSKKMLIISDLIKNTQKDFFKKILEYIKNNKLNESSNIFIFIEKCIKSKEGGPLIKTIKEKEALLNLAEGSLFTYLKGQKYSQELKNHTNIELGIFIKNEFQKNNLIIDNRNIELIISLSEGNIWVINNEVNKIINFKLSANDNKVVNKNDIKENISEKFQENIFAFTDALSVKNKKLALTILEQQYLAGLEPSYILNMMLRQFKILLQIKENLDLNYGNQKIISNLKLHPFIINKGINQAKNFEKNILIKIINELNNLEHQSRQTNFNLKASLNLLIAKI